MFNALTTLRRKVGSFSPLKLGGALFYTKTKNESRESWDTADYQLNNEVKTLPPNTWHQGLEFTSVNTDHIETKTFPVLNSYEIGFWIKWDAIGGLEYAFTLFDGTNNGIRIGQNNNRAFFSHNANGGGNISDFDLTANEWYYYRLYCDGTGSTLYLYDRDGVLLGFDGVAASTDINISITGTIAKRSDAGQYGDITIKEFVFRENPSSSIVNPQTPFMELASDSNTTVALLLADYDVADGARSAGDVVLDYSGNGNDGTIQGTSVTPVYTAPVGYQVREDKYNVVLDQYIFDTGNGTDIQGNPIPAFVGAAAPDAKAFTGGAIEFTAANSDYVDIPRITTSINDPLTIIFIVKPNIGDDRVLANRNTAIYQLNIKTTFVQLSGGSGAVKTFTISETGTEYIEYALVYDGDILSFYRKGVFIDSESGLDFVFDFNSINNINGNPEGLNICELAVFNSALSADRILEYYNNPNKFVEYVRADGALLAYDFNQGTYSAGSVVIDVSGNGNHGTVQGASAEMSVNNLEVGSQTATHGFSLYKEFDGNLDGVVTGLDISSYTDLSFYVDFIPYSTNFTSTLIGDDNSTADVFYIFDNTVRAAFGGFSQGVNAAFSGTLSGTLAILRHKRNRVTLTVNGSTVKMWLNGASIFNGVLSGIDILSWNNVQIGQRAVQGAHAFDGIILEVGIWDSAVSDANALSLSDGSVKPDDLSGKTGHWFGTDYVNKVNGALPTYVGNDRRVRVLSNGPKGTTDIFGNPVQFPWVQGLFNFNGMSFYDDLIQNVTRGGVVLKEHVDPVPTQSIFLVFDDNNQQRFAGLYNTARNGQNTITISVSPNDGQIFLVVQNNDGVTSVLSPTGIFNKKGLNFICCRLYSNGFGEVYFSDGTGNMSLVASGSINYPVENQYVLDRPFIGFRYFNIPDQRIADGYLNVLLYNRNISIDEMNKLKDFYTKIINKLP